MAAYGRDAISSPNLTNRSFYWQYERPLCAGGATPPTYSTAGAIAVVNNNNSDFALLQLSEDPQELEGVMPYYLGWDRSGSAGTGGVGIHHPSGDAKKIATYTITPSNSDCMGTLNSNFWKINWIATANGHSVTEGGSSGSPLINSSKKVIGQLFGSGFCDNTNSPTKKSLKKRSKVAKVYTFLCK